MGRIDVSPVTLKLSVLHGARGKPGITGDHAGGGAGDVTSRLLALVACRGHERGWNGRA